MDTMATRPPRSGTAHAGMTLVEVTISIAVMVIGFLAVILAFSQGLQWAGEITMGHTLNNAVRSAVGDCMVRYPSAEAFRNAAATAPQGGINFETAGYAMKLFPGRLVHLQPARGTRYPQEALEYGGWFTNTGERNRVLLEHLSDGIDVSMPFVETNPDSLPIPSSSERMVFESGAGIGGMWTDPLKDSPSRLGTGELQTLRIVAYRNKTERDKPDNEDKALGIFFVNVFFRRYD